MTIKIILSHLSKEDDNFAILDRPPYQLRNLPVQMRWEATRRHPSYQLLWNYPPEVSSTAPSRIDLNATQVMLRQVLLIKIGYSGPTISPSTEFNDIGEDEFPEWMSGSIHPISTRGMLSIALLTLSHAALKDMARLFEYAAKEESEDDDFRAQAYFSLLRVADESLDQYPDELIVSLAPQSSVKQFQADAKAILARFQEHRNLHPARTRADRYEDYLRIWDMREGWCHGQYQSEREMTLSQIASQTGDSIKTIHNRYRSSFELITGHKYTPELWFRVMGPLRFTDDELQEISIISKRRPRKSSTRQEIPDSRLNNPEHDDTLVTSKTQEDNSLELAQMRLDVQSLIAKGWDNDRIARELNPDEPHPDIVQKFRMLYQDLPS
ncbi:hypothetical protein V6x_51920 [Gimesia chilikensis]|uniref:Uncharacterized protein n=1 Tax=Gimesia chilikensis TaxID=2605989 RepID=A0A517WJN0_9PLAN|nr:hypothetical protein [Gimesia chilikensis]QDU05455.1 hypothetical protein V6x_51920 [Gimesia chilikensis]